MQIVIRIGTLKFRLESLMGMLLVIFKIFDVK